jgi:hypothetical protein
MEARPPHEPSRVRPLLAPGALGNVIIGSWSNPLSTGMVREDGRLGAPLADGSDHPGSTVLDGIGHASDLS